MDRWADLSIDHIPSTSGMEIEDRKHDIMWLLKVRGHGVILLKAQLVKGKWEFAGMSTFTDAEIGWRR